MKTNQVDIATEVMKGLLRGGLTITDFAAALNNTFVHAEIFYETGQDMDNDDILLGKLYEGIEKFKEAARMIRKYDGGEVKEPKKKK
jgi:hypothetical protein